MANLKSGSIRDGNFGPVTGANATATAVATIGFWILEETLGLEAPIAVVGATITLLILVVGRLVPPKYLEIVENVDYYIDEEEDIPEELDGPEDIVEE